MNHDLIERYIYAVTKRLPYKTREDVAQELRTLIDDMLKERCGEITPTQKDVKIVLTELGTPDELYEQYGGDGKKCLIGPPYYNTYILVIKIVLICTVFGMTLSSIISFGMSAEEVLWYQAVWQWIGMLWSSALSAFGFVTALFAFFDYKGVTLDSDLGLEDLPPVPKKEEQIKKGDTILGICISIIFLIVFLVCPEIFACAIVNGKFISLFYVPVIRSTWYIIIMFSVLGITRDIVKLIDGKYTNRVMLTTVVTDVLSAFCTVWWLTTKNIINPDFSARMEELFAEDGAFIVNIFSNFQYFFMGVILFALLLDGIVTVVKWAKINRGEKHEI